mmetsp:Transcript_45593/g.105788  ORF Transcript_45593/g.105788 Transcript_45593/m.105788 type:complete len:95 (+) Transcript_45593:2548-2832(+)
MAQADPVAAVAMADAEVQGALFEDAPCDTPLSILSASSAGQERLRRAQASVQRNKGAGRLARRGRSSQVCNGPTGGSPNPSTGSLQKCEKAVPG